MSDKRNFDLVKRETGVNPVRTRHCNWGVETNKITGIPGRKVFTWNHESGDLPYIVQKYCSKPRVTGCTF